MQQSAFAQEADKTVSLVAAAVGLVLAGFGVRFLQPWWNPTTDVFVAAPAMYALGVAGAALMVFLLTIRISLVDNDRLRWMTAGVAIAGTSLLLHGLVVADLDRVPQLATPSGTASLSLVWHAALALFTLGGALAPDRHRLRQALTLVFVALLVTVMFEPAWRVLPPIVDGSGRLTPIFESLVTGQILLTLTVAVVFIVVRWKRTTRPDVWMAIMLLLSGLDLASDLRAELWFELVWWNSVVLRAATFFVPAAGLLVDNARMVGLLNRHEQGLRERLEHEIELAMRTVAGPLPDRAAEGRVRRVLAEEAFVSVFQPIVSLASGELLAVEALTRFTAEPPRSPQDWFEEADAVGLGSELELATIAVALKAARGLPKHVTLSVNASPTTLADPRLLPLLGEVDEGRGMILELTEHAPISDYENLQACLAELRRVGIRLAIDDAGAGYASMRHVLRLSPEVIKLDISLTRDIHLDPVRRALAESLTEFAGRTGATITAEGVEHVEELATLREIGITSAQGYLLSPPVPVDQLPLVELPSRSRLRRRRTVLSRLDAGRPPRRHSHPRSEPFDPGRGTAIYRLLSQWEGEHRASRNCREPQEQ